MSFVKVRPCTVTTAASELYVTKVTSKCLRMSLCSEQVLLSTCKYLKEYVYINVTQLKWIRKNR